MWLDRLSNQPTPSASPPPGPRGVSPAPRRSMHLAPGLPSRPGYNPRNSSLSLISRANSSTNSLPGTGRPPNGSTLRQEITPPAPVEDALEVLQKIVGSKVHKIGDGVKIDQGQVLVEKPEELAKDITFDGFSLEDFVNNKEDLSDLGVFDTYRVNIQSVEEYDREKDRFEDLHNSILACDNVLQSVELSLTGFQKDLGVVSAEIETLQNRSAALSTRLGNRKVVEKLLGPAVEDISISPSIVSIISEGRIDDSWLKALADLEKRLKAFESRSQSSANIRAFADVKPLLDNLSNKAVERIRDYLVAQIKALRSPSINAQIIQQQTLARYKDLYVFLAKYHPQLAEEIGQAYVNTIRWYYLNHFTRYRHALDKLSIYHVDKYDALGSDPSIQRSNKSASSPTSHNVFNVGRRADLLKPTSQSAMSSYLASEDKSTHHIETAFHNFNLALVDNLTAEYAFLTAFFSTSTSAQMSLRCTSIFGPTFALGYSLTHDLIDNSYDCLGILLCVRLNQHAAFELQRRKVPVADTYINGTNMLLWPRFQLAMDLHCESMRILATTLSTRTAASKLSFAGSASDASKLSTAPHYLTQRFGQFLYGILAVSREAGDDEPVSSSLVRLRGEYEGFLAKASKGAGADQRKRDRFLANNYALVLTIVADAGGKLAEDQRAYFEGLMAGVQGPA